MSVEVVEAFRDPCILAIVTAHPRSDTMYKLARIFTDILPAIWKC